MNNIFFRSILAVAIVFSIAKGQKIATITVSGQQSSAMVHKVVSLDLDKITFLSADKISLHLVLAKGSREIPFQLNQDQSRTLNWIVDNSLSGDVVYELHEKAPRNETEKLALRKKNGALIFSDKSNDLLAYQYETFYPPAAVDSAYKRSAYIHPLWSPRGQVLTRIQPPDHYHHYGIWNPWTHVLFESDTVDFWNLKKGQGTIRHGKFISIKQGAVFNEFQALHEHVLFKKDGSQKTALNEVQTVRVYKPQGDSYIMDFIVNLNCAADSPVKLLEYRYGGFGWRATEQWNKDNSEMLSSEGKTRKDIDNTNAEWFYVQGEVDKAYAGILMMSHPANFNHPQPLRMWGIPEEGPGDVFASFSPTRDTDWLLELGRSYTLRYRFVVYNGHLDSQTAQKFWENYTRPLKISVAVSQ